MGKMNELSMTLDELIDTGQKLTECGEALIRTANEIRATFTETTPEPKQNPPEMKTCTYEEARAVLAEKARTGFRAEVKAILTAHGLKQLSDAKDPELYAAIVAEAEAVGNG